MKTLFAPVPTDTSSQAFFAVLGAVALATIGNGFAHALGVAVPFAALVQVASSTLLLS